MEYPEIEEVEIPDLEDMTEANDPGGFLAHTVKAKITERTKIREQREEKKVSLFGTIWGQLSLESKDKVKEALNYEEIETSQDPLLLWPRIWKPI